MALPGVSEESLRRDADASLERRIVRSERAWAELAPHWNALLDATPGVTAYQSYEYLRGWWAGYGAGRELWIVTLWRDERLLGIAPLCGHTRRGLLGPVRELTFLGAGCNGETSLVDRPQLLFGTHVEPCLAALLEWLADRAAPWDVLRLHEQDPQATLTASLRAWARAQGFLGRESPDAASAYVPITGDFEAFLTERGGNFRRKLRAARRRLDECGAVQLERYCGPAAIAALGRYRALERQSWKQGGAAAVGGARRALYDALAAGLAESHDFWVSLLSVDGRPVAAALALVHGRVFHGLEVAYDAEFARCSPGSLIQEMEFQQAFALGCREIDLRAGQLEYKKTWTPDVRETHELWIARPQVGLRLERLARDLQRSLKESLRRSGWLPLALRGRDWLRARLGGGSR